MDSEEFINTLGYYEFESYRHINPLKDEDGLLERTTSIHEFQHFILTTRSNYGMILYALRKLQRTADWYAYSKETKRQCTAFMKFLIQHSIKVQEGIATFVQWYFIYRSGNKIEADQFFKELPKEYCEYIKPLSVIIEKIKLCSSNFEKTDVYVSLVIALGLDALNIPIDDLMEKRITSKKEYDKFCSYENNAEIFYPNSKYKKNIKKIEKNMKTDTLENVIKQMINKEIFNNDIEFIQEKFSKVKKYVGSVFKDSKEYMIIEKTLNEIRPEAKDLEDALFEELPMIVPLKNDIRSILAEKIFSKIDEKKYGFTLFLLGNIYLKGYGQNVQNVNTYLKKNSEKFTSVLFYDLSLRQQYVSNMNNDTLKHILNKPDSELNFVVNYKAYNYNSHEIINIGKYNHNIYIYCDRTYQNTKKYINKFGTHKVLFTALKYQSMYILIFYIYKQTYFFLPVTDSYFNMIVSDIEKEWSYFENVIDENPIDGKVIIDKKQKKEIDIMVASLFFMAIDPKDPRYRKKMKSVTMQ